MAVLNIECSYSNGTFDRKWFFNFWKIVKRVCFHRNPELVTPYVKRTPPRGNKSLN